jgi:hypothetical protein
VENILSPKVAMTLFNALEISINRLVMTPARSVGACRATTISRFVFEAVPISAIALLMSAVIEATALLTCAAAAADSTKDGFSGRPAVVESIMVLLASTDTSNLTKSDVTY